VTTPTQTTPQPAPTTLQKHPRPSNGHGSGHPYTDAEYASMLLSSQNPMTPHTPTHPTPSHPSHPPGQPNASRAHQERDDGGPFKAEMVARMEGLAKGERVMPPCDRCRRLHMDCLKNLTACQGCTKKHAKCSWKEVREDELHATEGQSQPPPVSVAADQQEHVQTPVATQASPSAPSAPPTATAPAPAAVQPPGFSSINVTPNVFLEGSEAATAASQPAVTSHESTPHENPRPAVAPAAEHPAPPPANPPQESGMSQNEIEQLLLQRTARLRESPTSATKRDEPGLMPEELSRPPSVPPGEGLKDERKDEPPTSTGPAGQNLEGLMT
jgi:hypothetical protein